MFDVNSVNPTYSIADLLAVIFLGMIGGIFGSLYNYLVDKVLRTYSIINEYVLEIPFMLMSLRLVIFVPVLSSVSHTHTHMHIIINTYICTQAHCINSYNQALFPIFFGGWLVILNRLVKVGY